MYSAMAPGVRRLKPKMSCGPHIQYWPSRQYRHFQHGTICSADHPIADGDVPVLGGRVVQLDDGSDELVAGNDLGLGLGRTVLVAPELRGAVIALQVAGADADRLHLDQGLARSGPGHGDLLEPVVPRPVADHGLHRLGKS